MKPFREMPGHSPHPIETRNRYVITTIDQLEQAAIGVISNARIDNKGGGVVYVDLGKPYRMGKHPLSQEIEELIANWGDKEEIGDGGFDLYEGEERVLRVKGDPHEPEYGVYMNGSREEDLRRSDLAIGSMRHTWRKRIQEIVNPTDPVRRKILDEARQADLRTALSVTVFVRR